MGKKPDENKSLADTAAAFGKFVYNGEDGTVLGRGASSWGRLGVFYLFYYAFLAGLFALSINLCISLLDENEPFTKVRLQVPGVTIQPKLPSNVELNSDIKYEKSKADSYKKYVDHLDEFLKDYENKTIFGDCSSDNKYGYEDGKPCIFVKVNKIIDWVPSPFLSLQTETDRAENRDSSSKAPALIEELKAREVSYDPDLMYIACYETKKEGKLVGVSYFPKTGGMPIDKFPYTGRNRNEKSDNHKTPLVAVQLNVDTTAKEEFVVGCKAYALNILDDDRTNAGYIHFKVEIKE